MLVISRKKDESIYVNGNIRIVVIDVRGDKVQLGIEAPSDVSVFRSEVLDKIKRERDASNSVLSLELARDGAVLQAEEAPREPERRRTRTRTRR